MPISIVANATANHAQSGMRVRNTAMALNTQRLASGLRVFSAKEDAAAMAVGTGLAIENSALKTASLNAGSGISTLQIADGGLGQINEILTRMLSLAQISSSGHQNDTIRGLADLEFQQLKSEVDRIARDLEFNGVNLLAGSRNFAVETASNVAAQGISNIHIVADQVTGDAVFRYGYNATTEVLTVNRIDGATTTTQTVDLTGMLDEIAGVGQNLSGTERLEVNFSSLGIQLTLDSSFARGTNIAPASTLTAGDLTVATPVYTPAATTVALDALNGLQALGGAYNATSGNLTIALQTDGVTAEMGAIPGISYRVDAGVQTASGAVSDNLIGAGPHTIEVYVDMPGGGTELLGSWATGAISTAGGNDGSLVLGLGTGLIGADYTDDNGSTRLVYKIGAGVEAGLDILNIDLPAATVAALGLTSANISTQMNADSAIVALQAAVNALSATRATVGAQQLRLEQVANALDVHVENNENARSEMLDVDVSKEITAFSSNQAMLEAGVAMLGRANRIPEMLLQLLQNG